MSSMVCRPLKRAKSTVGVPLISETLSPLASDGVDALNWTANEVTEAMGASVPMTKDGPVGPVAGVLPATAARREERGNSEREKTDWKFAEDVWIKTS